MTTLAVLTVALGLVSGQWAVVSGQCVTAVTLPPGLQPPAAGHLPPMASNAQIKLGEEPVDPEKEKAAAVARAKAYLGKKLKLDPEKLVLESATPATWPDAALGCPEKDRMYAQVVTSGYKVLLKADDGTRHEVHVAGNRAVSCPAKPAK